MRLLDRLLMASVLYLRGTTGLTATSNGKLTNDTAPTVLPRVTIDGSAPSTPLESGVFLVDGIDHDYGINEERGRQNGPSLLFGAMDAVRTKVWLWRKKHPAEVLKVFVNQAGQEDHPIYEKFEKWIKYANVYHAKHPTYGDDLAVDQLMTKVGGKKKLAAYFRRLLAEYNMQVRAKLGALAVGNTDTFQLILRMWLKAGLKPDEVYHMMPIAEAIQTRGIEDSERWHDICNKLNQWVWYYKDFAEPRRKKISEKRELEDDYDFHAAGLDPEHDILKDMMEHSELKNLVAFLEHLRRFNSMSKFRQTMQQLLLITSPTEAEPLMFKEWADLKLNLIDVYESMPISKVDHRTKDDAVVLSGPSAFRTYLEQLLRYVDDQVPGNFRDDIVIDVLTQNRALGQLRKYLIQFKAKNKVRGLRLQQALDFPRRRTIPQR